MPYLYFCTYWIKTSPSSIALKASKAEKVSSDSKRGLVIILNGNTVFIAVTK